MNNNFFTVALPATFAEFVQAAAQAGGFETADAYVGALVEADQRRKELEHLEAELLKGLDSGPPVEYTPEVALRKRQDLFQRLGIAEKS